MPSDESEERAEPGDVDEKLSPPPHEEMDEGSRSVCRRATA